MESAVLAFQVMTVDQSRLAEFIGEVSRDKMLEVDRALLPASNLNIFNRRVDVHPTWRGLRLFHLLERQGCSAPVLRSEPDEVVARNLQTDFDVQDLHPGLRESAWLCRVARDCAQRRNRVRHAATLSVGGTRPERYKGRESRRCRTRGGTIHRSTPTEVALTCAKPQDWCRDDEQGR